MSKSTAIAPVPFSTEDKADDANGNRTAYDEATANNPDVVIYRISGAFFFGAAASIGAVLDRISDTHRALVIDFSAVPFVDSTAANTIENLAPKTHTRQGRIVLQGSSQRKSDG